MKGVFIVLGLVVLVVGLIFGCVWGINHLIHDGKSFGIHPYNGIKYSCGMNGYIEYISYPDNYQDIRLQNCSMTQRSITTLYQDLDGDGHVDIIRMASRIHFRNRHNDYITNQALFDEADSMLQILMAGGKP